MAGERDRRYLLRLDDYQTLPEVPVGVDLERVYAEIYYQFVDEFGVGVREQQAMELRRDILEMQIDLMVIGDQTLKARIALLEKRLNDMMEQGDNVNIFEVAAVLSKDAGYDISPTRLSVAEFYSKLKRYEKEQSARAAAE
jgi:hypothetical protein